MNLRNRLKRLLTPRKHYVNKQIRRPDIEAEADPARTVVPQPSPRRGGIIRTHAKTWALDEERHGGRVVRAMPREIRQLKESQEANKPDG